MSMLDKLLLAVRSIWVGGVPVTLPAGVLQPPVLNFASGATGASARVSNGCDFSGVATAYATAGSGAISRGTVAANGSTPVATAFPDFLATDKVTITPTASVGLAFVSSKTAGTGFSITSTAGDTQTYDYVIE